MYILFESVNYYHYIKPLSNNEIAIIQMKLSIHKM